jgi:hypothetical protein
MKKIIGLFFISITLTSCLGDGIERTKTNNDEYKVTYLFEKDGVKVYRFHDGLETHYFTTMGETMTTQGNDKSHHEENIKTKYETKY